MRTYPRIFLSYVSNPHRSSLPRELDALYRKELSYKFYDFQSDERRGGQFATTIGREIANAHFFVLLIDSPYLSSGWCFLEYLLLKRRNDELCRHAGLSEDFFITVFTEDATQLRDADRAQKARHVDQTCDRVIEIFRDYPHLTSEFGELNEPAPANATTGAAAQATLADISRRALQDQVNAWWHKVVITTNLFFDLTAEPENFNYEVVLQPEISKLRSLILRDFATPDDQTKEGKFHRLINQAMRGEPGDPWVSLRLSVNAACALASFSLRFDRFHEGGWGFSFGNLFDRDDDGNFYSHGRYDTNTLILDAVSVFLPEQQAADLHGTTFYPMLRDSITPRFDYEDRKPQITRLACALARPRAFSTKAALFFPDLVRMENYIVKNTNRPGKVTQRWRLIESLRRLAGETDDTLTFELLSRIAGTAQNSVLMNELEKYYNGKNENPEDVKDQLREAATSAAAISSEMTQTIQKKLDKLMFLFGSAGIDSTLERWTTLVDFAPIRDAIQKRDLEKVFSEVGSAAFRAWYSQSLLRLFRPLFLLRFDSGRQLLMTWGTSWVNTHSCDDDLRNWDTLLRFIEAQLNSKDKKEIRVMCGRLFVVATLLLLVCVRLKRLACCNVNSEERAHIEESCEANCLAWARFVERRANSSMLFNMDSAGWAAILMVTDEIASLTRRPDYLLSAISPSLTQAWNAAEGILEARRALLVPGTNGKRAQQLNDGVRLELIKKTQEGFIAWLASAQQDAPGIRDVSDHWSKCLTESSFFNVGFAARSRPGESRHAGDVLMGKLKVRREMRDDKWVDEIADADRGYNELFIAPIGNILDLHIPDLNRLRGLLGHKDGDLIDVVGRSVVEECYVLVQNGTKATWASVPFDEATREVVKRLANPLLMDSDRGHAHLLRIRSYTPTGKISRWVLRTAVASLARTSARVKRKPCARPIEFMWRFIEVTLAVDGGAINVPREALRTASG